jgi:hypothetical protein
VTIPLKAVDNLSLSDNSATAQGNVSFNLCKVLL